MVEALSTDRTTDWRSRERSVLDQRVDVVALELLAAVEERQVDDEGAADDLAAELLDQPSDRVDGAAGREHVVVDQDAHALPEGRRVQLERVLAVLERIGDADRVGRQLSRAARGHEAAADLAGERRSEDEPA